MVEVGLTINEPIKVLVDKLAGVIETEEALETDQERVVEVPGWIADKEDWKEAISGATPEGVTLPLGEEDTEVPAAFVAVTVKV